MSTLSLVLKRRLRTVRRSPRSVILSRADGEGPHIISLWGRRESHVEVLRSAQDDNMSTLPHALKRRLNRSPSATLCHPEPRRRRRTSHIISGVLLGRRESHLACEVLRSAQDDKHEHALSLALKRRLRTVRRSPLCHLSRADGEGPLTSSPAYFWAGESPDLRGPSLRSG